MRITIIPIILVFSCFIFDSVRGREDAVLNLVYFVLGLLLVPVWISCVSVACHRAVLFKEVSPPLFRFGAREIKYALAVLILGPTTILFKKIAWFLGPGFAGATFQFLYFLIPVAYILIWPCLPVLSADIKISKFGKVWARTKGNRFRIFLLNFAFCVLLALGLSLAQSIGVTIGSLLISGGQPTNLFQAILFSTPQSAFGAAWFISFVAIWAVVQARIFGELLRKKKKVTKTSKIQTEAA